MGIDGGKAKSTGIKKESVGLTAGQCGSSLVTGSFRWV